MSDLRRTVKENASGSATGAGAIASTAAGNNSAYAKKARKDKKEGKKTETIFAISN